MTRSDRIRNLARPFLSSRFPAAASDQTRLSTSRTRGRQRARDRPGDHKVVQVIKASKCPRREVLARASALRRRADYTLDVPTEERHGHQEDSVTSRTNNIASRRRQARRRRVAADPAALNHRYGDAKRDQEHPETGRLQNTYVKPDGKTPLGSVRSQFLNVVDLATEQVRGRSDGRRGAAVTSKSIRRLDQAHFRAALD